MKTEQGNAGAQGAEASEAAGATGLSVDEATALLAKREMPEEESAAAAGETKETTDAKESETDAGAAGESDEESPEKRQESVEFSPEQQAILDREIGKKVAKHKEEMEGMQARIAELEEQLAVAPRESAERRGSETDLVSMRPEQLDRYEADLQARIDWLEMNQDGYEADPEVKDDVSLTRQQVLKALVQSRQAMREVPKARLAQQQFREAEAAAVQMYPDMARSRADRKIYDGLCARVPGFRNLPNGLVIVGDMLAGERARLKAAEEALKKKPAGAPAAKPLPGQGGVKRPAVATAGKPPVSYDIAQMVSDGGGVDAATKLMVEREKRRAG
jgi:hypothetical protein